MDLIWFRLKFIFLIKIILFIKEEDKFKTMVNLSKVLIRKEEYEKQLGVELPFVLHGFFNFMGIHGN